MQYFQDEYMTTQEICIITIESMPYVLDFIPDQYITQERDAYTFVCVPDRCNTLDMHELLKELLQKIYFVIVMVILNIRS